VASDCVVNFDNIHTLPRARFRRRVAVLSDEKLVRACRTLAIATGC
jgi:mRNA interferase MazF